MLKRKIETAMIQWKNSKNKKCLIVEGARQVGKTFIIEHFAKENYSNVISLNFVSNPSYKQMFEGDLDIETLLANISLHTKFGNKLEPYKTLIFLDEIQACPKARTALKFFAQDDRYDVIASGSMLGISYSAVDSYPTGYVEFLKMTPLDFEEFLWANGVSTQIIETIESCYRTKSKVNDAINSKIMELFRQFMVVGGMPNVVKTFIYEQNYAKVLKVQRDILRDYKNDIAKYADGAEKTKATACFESVARQLAKENKKFQYSVVEKNTGSKKYQNSVNWLVDAGIVCLAKNVSRLEAPLAGFVVDNCFKLYMQDTGLLTAMLDDGTNAQIISGELGIYKGAIFENVVAQILSSNEIPLYYYTRNNSLELDFIVSKNGKIVPLEVKASNGKAKSLATIISESPEISGIKLVTGNVGVSDRITTLPIYMIMFI